MKRLPPLPLLLTSRPSRAYAARTLPWTCSQCIHTSARRSANPLPLTATGPPPSAPLPAASQHGERVDRRRRQAELVKRGQELRGAQTNPGSAMKKRFWKDVHIKRDKGELSNHRVNLVLKSTPALQLAVVIRLTHSGHRKKPYRPSRFTPSPKSNNARSTPDPSIQTSPRHRRSSRMGQPDICTTSTTHTPDPPHLNRLPRPKPCSRRRPEHQRLTA